ncbi:hypothetical protein B4966_00020 [Rhodocyclaceae bacterium]|nr:hypothetical protein B4966_00020 [Rhodocyclaceae bacterium]
MPSNYRRPFGYGRVFVSSGEPLSLWQKIVAAVVTGAVFVLALMFSVVLFAVLLTVGAVLWGWFMWKTRALRSQMYEMRNRAPRRAAPGGGVVIEGEVIREVREEQEVHKPR